MTSLSTTQSSPSQSSPSQSNSIQSSSSQTSSTGGGTEQNTVSQTNSGHNSTLSGSDSSTGASTSGTSTLTNDSRASTAENNTSRMGDRSSNSATLASLGQALEDAIAAEGNAQARDGSSSNVATVSAGVKPDTTKEASNANTSTDANVDSVALAALNSAKADSESVDEKAKDAKKSTAKAQARLRQVLQATGVKPALLYVIFTSASGEMAADGDDKTKEDGKLTSVLVPPEGSVIAKQVQGIQRSQVMSVANQLRKEIVSPRTTRYLPHAQKLYQWMIAPIEAELQANKIQSLSVITEAGLRSLPISALNDGKQFLIEKYSVALMPSLNLTDTRLANIRQTKMLAMGASTFGKETKLADLPAVPVELSSIAGNIWEGDSAIDSNFTFENLIGKRSQRPYGIIHLATHADFEPGKLSNSYIQLWNKRLRQCRRYCSRNGSRYAKLEVG